MNFLAKVKTKRRPKIPKFKRNNSKKLIMKPL